MSAINSIFEYIETIRAANIPDRGRLHHDVFEQARTVERLAIPDIDAFERWVWNGFRMLFPLTPETDSNGSPVFSTISTAEFEVWRAAATPFIDKLRRPVPQSNQEQAQTFPPLTFVDVDQREYRFSTRLLWELWKAIYNSRYPIDFDDLEDRIPTWKNAYPSDDAIEKQIKHLRLFWRGQNPPREDLAAEIKVANRTIIFEKT